MVVSSAAETRNRVAIPELVEVNPIEEIDRKSGGLMTKWA